MGVSEPEPWSVFKDVTGWLPVSLLLPTNHQQQQQHHQQQQQPPSPPTPRPCSQQLPSLSLGITPLLLAQLGSCCCNQKQLGKEKLHTWLRCSNHCPSLREVRAEAGTTGSTAYCRPPWPAQLPVFMTQALLGEGSTIHSGPDTPALTANQNKSP